MKEIILIGAVYLFPGRFITRLALITAVIIFMPLDISSWAMQVIHLIA